MSSPLFSCSKEWANSLLRYGILVLKTWWASPTSTRLSVVYKIRLVRSFINQLDLEGFWWQRDRLKNHLHRYMASLPPKADTPSEGGMGVSH